MGASLWWTHARPIIEAKQISTAFHTINFQAFLYYMLSFYLFGFN